MRRKYFKSFICEVCSTTFPQIRSDKASRFCSLRCYWRSDHISRASRQTQIRRVEEGTHNLYRGGITDRLYLERKGARRSRGYRQWRAAVYKRDDYTCQICGRRGGELQADHIKSFAFYPKLRFAVENGRTLCVPCHRKTPNYGMKARLLAEDDGQIEDLHITKAYDKAAPRVEMAIEEL